MNQIVGGAYPAFGSDGQDELAQLLAGADFSGAYDIAGADPMAPAAPHHGGHHGGWHRPHQYLGPLGYEMDEASRIAYMRRIASRNAAVVVDRPMNRARQLPLGFPAASIAGGGTVASPTSAVSFTQPQVTYRGQRLFVVPSAMGVCIVQDLKVGKDSQFVAAEPVPAEMFSPLSFGSDMNLDTAQVSQILALYLGNIAGAAISVTAALQGTACY